MPDAAPVMIATLSFNRIVSSLGAVGWVSAATVAKIVHIRRSARNPTSHVPGNVLGYARNGGRRELESCCPR